MKTDDLLPYTIVKTEQKFIEETFPLYMTCLGFGMYLIHYFITFVFLGLSDQTLVLDRIIWIGTYITPYLFHFWIICALFLLIFLFLRDYRRGFKQIKLERHQITLYPKQKGKERKIISWQDPIQNISLVKEKHVLEIDLENRCLLIPSSFYSSDISKIAQFYDASLIKEEQNKQIDFQNED